MLLLLFLVFSLARPNKKELLQKESFLSETLFLLCFSSVFARPAQQERITLKRKKRPLTITKACGTPTPQLVIGFPITNVSLLTPPQVVIVRSHYAFEVWLGPEKEAGK